MSEEPADPVEAADPEETAEFVETAEPLEAAEPSEIADFAGHRCGVVAIAGRPNVGKSTLLNKMLGAKIAIVTPKPQTTRDRILGILTRPEAQFLFQDTPGIHQPPKPLNRRMMAEADAALADADVVLVITDASKAAYCLKEDGLVLERVRAAGKPTVLAINKIDLLDKPALLPLMLAYGSAGFNTIVPISAVTGDGLEEMIAEVIKHLPEGPSLYPEDELSDRSLRFLATEIVREKLTLNTRKEIPYSTAVTIDTFTEPELPLAVLIEMTIHVERSSQKAIVIGKGGSMLKRIGTEARIDLENLMERKVMLKLFVRVDEEWASSDAALRRLLDE
jgi:GTP-binding protein Era